MIRAAENPDVQAKPQSYSVPQLAARYQTNQTKVLTLIRAGELVAVNIALTKRKPRWRITQEAIEAFEAARSSKPAPKPDRRRSEKKPAGWVDYY